MRNHRKEPHPSIVEAVETLSNIAEMDFDRDFIAENLEETAESEGGSEGGNVHQVRWFDRQETVPKIDIIKEIFQVILDYLRTYYKKEYRHMSHQQITEGIKAVMVLVGEAAKKLDQHPEILQKSKVKSIMQLKEYKKLQEFYLSHVVRKIDEGILSRWILALSERILEQNRRVEHQVSPLISANHIFVDIEAVKKDSDYELFFIRKEDGTRFFSPRLIRNIKLVCNFGSTLNDLVVEDPLEDLFLWRDRMYHAIAKEILHAIAPLLDQFYHEFPKDVKAGELDILINRAILALMLGGNSYHLYHIPEIKSCTHYFVDFQLFLREALQSRDYQHLITYPPSASESGKLNKLQLLHTICKTLFLNLTGFQELLPNFLQMITQAVQYQSSEHVEVWTANKLLWSHLASDYAAILKLMKKHPNGPLIKVLDVLEQGNYSAFDPLIQGNLPQQLFGIQDLEHEVISVHMATPTHQEFIDKVQVIEEFKGFLRKLRDENKVHLLINLQDRTAWNEKARASILENLQNNPEFSKTLRVVTLDTNTDFYHQEGQYKSENHAHAFLKSFKQEIEREDGGFFFPADIKKVLLSTFIDPVLTQVHQQFFGGRNVLIRQHRLDFIQIFYLFLELKLIELTDASSFSLACKDGVDTGAAANALLFIFIKWMKIESLSKEDLATLNLILYAPSLLVRERTLQKDCFNRIESVIRKLEDQRNEQGWKVMQEAIVEKFGPYYNLVVN